VSRSLAVTAGSGHAHSSELTRWDDVFSGSPHVDEHPRRAYAELLVAGVRAAVVAPEKELKRWFSWLWYWDDALVDDLVGDGRLQRVDGHVALR
jgi:hypothetical protein